MLRVYGLSKVSGTGASKLVLPCISSNFKTESPQIETIQARTLNTHRNRKFIFTILVLIYQAWYLLPRYLQGWSCSFFLLHVRTDDVHEAEGSRDVTYLVGYPYGKS